MTRFEEAKQSLIRLISENAPSFGEFKADNFDIYRVNQTINRNHEDFQLHFDDDTPNFTDYAKGTLLASEPGREYHAEQDGEAIVFPNANVAIGQRALLTVIPAEVDQ